MVARVLHAVEPELSVLCQRWQIAELAVFGSGRRDDLRPESDLDLLVTFLPGAAWTLLDQIAMQVEFASLLNRPVDLVSRRAIERSANPLRRREILDTARRVYATR